MRVRRIYRGVTGVGTWRRYLRVKWLHPGVAAPERLAIIAHVRDDVGRMGRRL